MLCVVECIDGELHFIYCAAHGSSDEGSGDIRTDS